MLDVSGGLILEMEWLNQPLSIGQWVRLTGAATVLKAGNIIRIGVDGLVVDDDGLHPLIERTGAVFLKAGRTPIQVEWFNRIGPFGLEVSCEGPDLPRRKLNDSELFRSAGATTNQMSGLDYRCYEGWWTELPDFSGLKPVKSGTVDNFDLGARTRNEGVGLQFSGFFEVPRDGIYKFHLSSDDGGRLSVGEPDVQVEIIGQSQLPAPRHMFIGQLLDEAEDGSWSQIEGKVTKTWPVEEGLRMELSVGLARMEAEVSDKAERPEFVLMNSLVRMTGFCQAARNSDGLKVPDLLLVPSSRLIELVAPPTTAEATNTNPAGLPVLTMAVEVHHLKRAEAQLRCPAKVRGVVTSIDPSTTGFTLQDSTGGLYVQGADSVRVGEFVEVEGVTDPGSFAPMLRPSRINRLGEGRLPEPIHPAWDQLMNGSLNAQYMEIEGIVTAVAGDGVQLLTHGGIIKATLQSGLNPEEMKRFENMLVRIRGVLLAVWNPQTHQVKLGEIRIFNPDVTAENPASGDAFSGPCKTAADLLLFDPQASLFQRIRMSGQIVHVGEEVCFMMAGTDGVRFVANTPGAFQVGDIVDVAGYPQLGGASPLLREAVVRKTGHAALPEARWLSPGNLASADYDSTRVRVEGVLAGVRETGTGMVLDMQDGVQSFVARLDGRSEVLLSLPIGGRLELTGVYAVQGGNQALDQPISSFELLLNSPSDIQVLARPPWWTLQRLLIIVGALACVLAATVLWISQLHRQVETRTAELEVQIQERQRVEHQRAMEQERSRIAQDLHDELGSGITEISMLVTVAGSASVPGNGQGRHLEEIGDRARQMVTALDEIVWAMNPKHDSLMSLVSYSCLYADRLLKLANIACQLKGAVDLPDRAVSSVHRHEFFLAFKEALTNVIRHSGATEVRLGVRLIGNRLRLSIADNGHGLAADAAGRCGDGLVNMRLRLEKMGGRFEIASQPGRGTTVRFYMPLN